MHLRSAAAQVGQNQVTHAKRAVFKAPKTAALSKGGAP